MRFWVSFAAWTLVPFGVLGLVWSLVSFSLSGIVLNAVIALIGLHDIWQLKRVREEPVRWRYLAVTQALIGLIIGVSLIWLGFTITHTAMWEEACNSAIEILGHPYGIEEAIERSTVIMEWGLVIAGVLVLLSKVWMAIKAYRLSSTVRIPPPLPKS